MPAAKKVAAKKTVAKKTASAAPSKSPHLVTDDTANARATAAKGPIGGKPKIHAKSVGLVISIGTGDRARTIEKFIADLEKKIGAVPYGEDGIHMTRTSTYYILDGKVCLPDDYDPKTQNFKPGAQPPTWAGGKDAKTLASTPQQEQMQRDAKELSSDAFDKKYKIGKYRHIGDPERVITPEMQKRAREDAVKARLKKEEEELAEFDWDMDDVEDEEALGKIADESASELAAKLKTKKRVVKKSTAPKTTTRRVVRRSKA